jgi:4a-hydroxytetrahydrobiopterin dehydratase
MDNWVEINRKLLKDFEFENFGQAMSFVNRIADSAEKADHHPNILIFDYNKVRITLTTHDEKAITKKDHDLAEAIDQL